MIGIVMNKLLLFCMQLVLINSTNILHGMPSHTSTESLASNASNCDSTDSEITEINPENHKQHHALVPEDAYQQFAARLEEKTFFESIRSNNYQQFIQLLETNHHFANLYLPEENETALTLATLHKQTTLVRKLLEYGANPNTPNSQDFTPLIIAAHNGFHEIIQLLLFYNAHIFYEHIFANKAERSFNDWLLEHSDNSQSNSSLRFSYKKEINYFPPTTALEHAIRSYSCESVKLLFNRYYHYFKRLGKNQQFCLFFSSHLDCVKNSIQNEYKKNGKDLARALSELEQHEQKSEELAARDLSTARHETIKQIHMQNLHKALEKKERLDRIKSNFLEFHQTLKIIKAQS